MVIGIIGESCVGKSTLAEKLKEKMPAEIYTGKDYLRLARSEAAAKTAFQLLLQNAVNGEHIIYVISETEHLPLLPEGSVSASCHSRFGDDSKPLRRPYARPSAGAGETDAGEKARLL